MSKELGPVLMLTQILYLYHEQTLKKEGEMLFLANEPAKKAEINILTARDTTGPRY